MNKIAIVGTRGVPAKYGGYETFADEFLQFSKGSYPISVVCEKVLDGQNEYYNSRLLYLNLRKSENQLLYYWQSIIVSLRENNIILITGPGAGLFLPFLQVLYPKKTFITNPDGLEFKRSKWSTPVRFLLWVMSWMSVLFSTRVIADSKGISDYYSSRLPFLKQKFSVIEYGSRLFEFVESYDSDYYLLVARFVPENNIEMIIRGFLLSRTKRTLKIISDTPNNAYMKRVKDLIGDNDNIMLLGPEYEQNKLIKLRCNAYAHIHGHSVGGTNPSLLEAMSAGAPTIAHDNIFNREVLRGGGFYFGSDFELAKEIDKVECLDKSVHDDFSALNRNRIQEYYNWERIFKLYLKTLLNE
jgi:glycosyltransferase involved in cell wall biosynthesis